MLPFDEMVSFVDCAAPVAPLSNAKAPPSKILITPIPLEPLFLDKNT